MAKKKKTQKKSQPKKLPSRFDLMQLFIYDPETGQLTKRKTGKPVGYKNEHGYVIVYIGKSRFYAHRVIYKMFHGVDPKGKDVDHRDGNPSNNAIINLRVVQRRTNLRNTAKRRSKEGLPDQDVNVHEASIKRHLVWNGVNDDF